MQDVEVTIDENGRLFIRYARKNFSKACAFDVTEHTRK